MRVARVPSTASALPASVSSQAYGFELGLASRGRSAAAAGADAAGGADAGGADAETDPGCAGTIGFRLGSGVGCASCRLHPPKRIRAVSAAAGSGSAEQQTRRPRRTLPYYYRCCSHPAFPGEPASRPAVRFGRTTGQFRLEAGGCVSDWTADSHRFVPEMATNPRQPPSRAGDRKPQALARLHGCQ